MQLVAYLSERFKCDRRELEERLRDKRNIKEALRNIRGFVLEITYKSDQSAAPGRDPSPLPQFRLKLNLGLIVQTTHLVNNRYFEVAALSEEGADR